MEVKLSKDMIKPFNGEGNLVAWLSKVKLVAKLQKISDLSVFMPLFLEGDALAIYLELSPSEPASADIIETRLKEAFTEGPFEAYGKLVHMKWTGEPVDVYANEVRRLAGLAGFSGDGLERIVKLTFVNGFPDNISTELQQMASILTLSMSKILVRARILAPGKTPTVTATAVKVAEGSGTRSGESRPFKGQCFRCGGPHMMRNCKDKKVVVCYRCGKEGHISSRCVVETAKKKEAGDVGPSSSGPGNAERGAVAPAVTL